MQQLVENRKTLYTITLNYETGRLVALHKLFIGVIN